jgi:lipoprotein NlpI
MFLAKLIRSSLLFVSILGISEAAAQQTVESPLKEVQLGTNSFTIANPVPSWVDLAPIPESDKPQPIVIRLAETQFLVDQIPATFVRRATLVNDAASLTSAGRFSIPFAPDYERVELHFVRIHRGSEELDRTKSSNVRFLQREQGLEGGIYTGHVTASILIEDLRVGDTLDIAYSTYGQNPVFDGKYFRITAWDQGLPTLRRRVVLNTPPARKITWRMVGDREMAAVAPKETMQGDMRRLEFNEQPLPQIVGETLTPPDFFAFRFLQFSEFSAWSEVAGWAGSLFEGKVSPDEELKATVSRLRGLDSDERRVAAALEFVQTQIRYFSVSLGESSHRPTSPNEVLRRRFGDCKDKSLLLITLLRELGIDSKPVLLQIGRHNGLEKTLPSPQFFNHAIVEVSLNGKSFFLDPTRLGQRGLLDRMGQIHEGTEVLIVSPTTRELSTIHTRIEDVVNDEITEHGTLPRFGEEGQLQVKHVWNGLGAEGLRVLVERVSRDQLLKSIGDAMERRYPGAKLSGEPTIQDDTVQNVFTIVANYKIPNFATEKDGNWVLAYRPDNLLNTLATSASATRSTPLRIPVSPFHGKYSLEMAFPETVSVVTDPRAQTFANQYFNATVTDYFRGNVAKKTIDLTTLRLAVDAANYPRYADDLRAMNKAIGGAFVINKMAIKSEDASAQLDFPHRLRNLREEVIKKTTETIGNGKLSGADLANAHCLRGTAYSDLDRTDEALEDANAAVRMDPNSPAQLTCRAEIYFHIGQLEKSIADYSKAVSLGSIEMGIFRGRGVSKFLLGRFEEARDDLTKAGELADKENKIYCDIWLAATYGRLGKPLPDDLVKRATADAHGEWPRAGLAMLTGAMTPPNLLSALAGKNGDDRQMALSEAYFYLGEHDIVTGDKTSAQANFEKARDQGVFIYTEHTAAGLELARLKAAATSASAVPPAPERAARP